MSNPEQQFYDSVQPFIDQYLKYFPVHATLLGDHRYDNELGDFSPAAVAEKRAWLESWMNTFEGYDTSDWSVAARIDCAMMGQQTRRALYGRLPFGYINFDWLDRNPSTVAYEAIYGINALVARESIPAEVRVANMISRMEATPRVLAEGRALIVPANTPPMWAAVGMEIAKWGAWLFSHDMPSYAANVPGDRERLLAAAQSAAQAMQEYAAWIQSEVLPQAAGDFTIGKEAYDEILLKEQLVDYDSDQLLEMATEIHRDLKRQMEEIAAQIDPSKTFRQILDESRLNHPASAEQLMADYTHWVTAARQFTIDNDLVSIPEPAMLPVVPTPPLLDAFFTYAGATAPALFESFQNKFVVPTPPEDPETAQKHLQRHHYGIMPVAVVHETYPGHHLQAVVTDKHPSLARRFGGFLFTYTLGGWAWYHEDLFDKMGFLPGLLNRLCKLEVHFLGVVWTIIDIKLHHRVWSIEQATHFFLENGIKPEYIRTALPMYSLLPTERHCDLFGKIKLQKLVADYQERFPQATLREIHDAILGCGMIPPDLIRLELLDSVPQSA